MCIEELLKCALLFYLPLGVLLSFCFLARFIAVMSIVLYVILALWPPALQFKLPALLFVCVFFFFLLLLFVLVLAGEPKQKQGRGLVDRKLVQAPPPPPSNFIAGRPKAALMFWFFIDFRCGTPLLIVILLCINIKIGKIDVNC